MRKGTGMRTSLSAAKLNLRSEDAQGRRLKNFVQIRFVSSVDIAHYLSHGQIFTGDEEFVILVTFEPKKKIQAFRLLAKLTHNLTLMRTPSQSVSPNYRIHG